MKSLFIFLLIVFSVCVFAQDYNIKNKDISVTLTETRPNNLVFSEISNLKTGKNMIVRPKVEDSLWMIEVRKGTDEAAKLELFPENADFMNVTKSKDTLKMVWENVKKGDMDNGFDVYATCKIKGIDSFWNIKIKTHSDIYSIWSVKYPNVTCIDAKDANVTYPLYGGMFDTNFHGYYEYAYPSIWYPMQWTFVTKGDTTLYMAAQDSKGKLKYFSVGDCGDQQMVFYVRNTPEYMGEAGHDYDQEYDFVLSPIEGDWYDAAKKYRKWGIDSKFIPFSRGKMETREDIPQWFKELPVWLRQEGMEDYKVDQIIDFAKYLDVPVATHTYYWSQNSFDTHYPNILPAQDVYKSQIEKYHAAGIKVMPYTNGRLVDIALSDYGKEQGTNLLALNEKGETTPEVWEHARVLGADNQIACPNSPYTDFQINEFTGIEKELGVDALYIDQVCCSQPMLCFNKAHNHPMGGGANWVNGHLKLMIETRKGMNQNAKEPVIYTSECAGEPYLYDAWLRCNECDPCLNDSPVQSMIYSGYVQSFGFYYYPNEFDKQDALPAINKTAVGLTKGYQLGWGFGWIDYTKYPDFAKYVKNACKGRHKAYKFFNLGEMVRNVNIISDIPQREIYFQNFAIESNNYYPLVRTCSHYYNGKAIITFTNISKENIPVSFTTTPKVLNLKNKAEYKISEFYPNEKEISKGKNIMGTVILEPLETKIIIVE